MKRYTIDTKATDIAVSHSKYNLVDIENHYAKNAHNLELIREIKIKDSKLGIMTLVKPVTTEGDRLSLSTKILNIDNKDVVVVKEIISAVTVDMNKICGRPKFSSNQLTLEAKSPGFVGYNESCKTSYNGLKKIVDHPEYSTLKNCLTFMFTAESVNFVSSLLKISVYCEAITLYAAEPFIIGALGLKVLLCFRE